MYSDRVALICAKRDANRTARMPKASLMFCCADCCSATRLLLAQSAIDATLSRA